MKAIYERNIEAALEAVTPLYDFVLVRRIPDEALHRGLIELPGKARDPERGLRKGEVISRGRGDKRADGSRIEMHVKRGDVVIYPRVPANDIRINGEEYTFCHEEQHILGILENNDGEEDGR